MARHIFRLAETLNIKPLFSHGHVNLNIQFAGACKLLAEVPRNGSVQENFEEGSELYKINIRGSWHGNG
jgi:hypothetical protein